MNRSLSMSTKNYKQYNLVKEKRIRTRVPFIQDLYYPVINGNSTGGLNNHNSAPVIKTIDINEYGLGIRSNVPLTEGDFLNLSIKVEESNTFECLCLVKWVAVDDNTILAGCEFCHIRNEDRIYIRKYMKKVLGNR